MTFRKTRKSTSVPRYADRGSFSPMQYYNPGTPRSSTGTRKERTRGGYW
jgi:hypothetical protein